MKSNLYDAMTYAELTKTLRKLMEERREYAIMAKVKLDKKILTHKLCINSDIKRCNSDRLEYTISELSLFVNNLDYECVIRSDFKELQNMSMKRGKLMGAIAENDYAISKINFKILHANSNMMAKPKGTTRHQQEAKTEDIDSA